MGSQNLSDQQDSEHFRYNRTWVDIETMLDKAERMMNHHHAQYITLTNKKEKLYHARNFKALQGVVKTLRWCLGDINVKHPLD